MTDGTDVQVGVETPKGPLDVGEGLVGRHHLGARQRLLAKARAQHVDPVQGRLGGDLVVFS